MATLSIVVEPSPYHLWLRRLAADFPIIHYFQAFTLVL
ncbi:hypothetical protein VP150E351_P0204 [Vibrio phage 150E35-1]|nr:hypothetical protein VP150E351_P0204 [Vibrio phage 150E35-1]